MDNCIPRSSNKSELGLLLIGEIRLKESVSRHDPFVINTREEVLQAIEDYRIDR